MGLNRVSIKEFSFNQIMQSVNAAYAGCSEDARKAIDHHYAMNLSYNCDTGVTRSKQGELARYANSIDIPVYEKLDEILTHQFIPFINNSISRLMRGLDA
jgi:hypothetical protein